MVVIHTSHSALLEPSCPLAKAICFGAIHASKTTRVASDRNSDEGSFLVKEYMMPPRNQTQSERDCSHHRSCPQARRGLSHDGCRGGGEYTSRLRQRIPLIIIGSKFMAGEAFMFKLVLLRHGESVWNKENLFTGWTDVGLSEKGLQEAAEAGKQLRKDGFVFDVAYTSVLKRAIKTLWLALEQMDQMYIPIHNTWRLNERHYGALQGLNKAQTAQKYGDAQVKIWRRSYDIQPPALAPDDERYPGKDPRYAGLSPGELPLTECLKDTIARTLPYWHDNIAPIV